MQQATEWIWSCGLSQTQSTPDRLLLVLYMENIPKTSHFLHCRVALLLRLQEPGRTFPKATKDFPGRVDEPLHMWIYFFPFHQYDKPWSHAYLHLPGKTHKPSLWIFLDLMESLSPCAGEEGMGPNCTKASAGKDHLIAVLRPQMPAKFTLQPHPDMSVTTSASA